MRGGEGWRTVRRGQRGWQRAAVAAWSTAGAPAAPERGASRAVLAWRHVRGAPLPPPPPPPLAAAAAASAAAARPRQRGVAARGDAPLPCRLASLPRPPWLACSRPSITHAAIRRSNAVLACSTARRGGCARRSGSPQFPFPSPSSQSICCARRACLLPRLSPIVLPLPRPHPPQRGARPRVWCPPRPHAACRPVRTASQPASQRGRGPPAPPPRPRYRRGKGGAGAPARRAPRYKGAAAAAARRRARACS